MDEFDEDLAHSRVAHEAPEPPAEILNGPIGKFYDWAAGQALQWYVATDPVAVHAAALLFLHLMRLRDESRDRIGNGRVTQAVLQEAALSGLADFKLELRFRKPPEWNL